MRIIGSISDIRAIVRAQKKLGKTIGLVPTMGYLHKGHISLVEASVRENDYTIISIFVNPTQFGPNEDYVKYPRNMQKDSQLAEEAGVDVVFAPEAKEIYLDGFKTYVNVEGITKILCGKTRPGHFKGVATIVNKLFNIIEPDKAYFGQKDAQQVAVIKRMAADLNINIEIVACPIVREHDGLAMSSRNTYLSPDERKAALVLSRSLFEAGEMIGSGERRKGIILAQILKNLNCEKLANIEYVDILNADTMGEIKKIEGKVLIALAVKFGTTRLIDNIILEV